MKRVTDWFIGAAVVFVATAATTRLCCAILKYPYTWRITVAVFLMACYLRAVLRK